MNKDTLSRISTADLEQIQESLYNGIKLQRVRVLFEAMATIPPALVVGSPEIAALGAGIIAVELISARCKNKNILHIADIIEARKYNS